MFLGKLHWDDDLKGQNHGPELGASDQDGLVHWLRDFTGPGSVGTNEAADVIESLQAQLAAEPSVAQMADQFVKMLRRAEATAWERGVEAGLREPFPLNPYRDGSK